MEFLKLHVTSPSNHDQHATQKGKKNMESLFGKEFAGTMPPSLSSPVLPGGVHISGSATMPRPKSASSRLTGLFNQPKPSIKGTLKDSLERYSLYGLGESPDYDYGLKNEIEDQIKLETSWTEVVDESHIGAMTKKQKDQQEAIWELLSTEAAYISKLFVIKKLFLQCLRNLQSEGFLAEIEASKLFSNVEEIYEVNLAFWTEHLSKVIENARQTKDLLNPQEMEAGFNMFETQFDPYIKYCMEESSCLKYFKEKLIESEDFKTYITWCEEHRFCTDRLKLNDLLVKPMQRVTKYPLLLRAIYNKTMDDDDIKELVNRMRDKVEAFVSKVNGAMRERHELEKLKATAEKIHNNYNVVEAVSEEMEKILQDYSSYDLTRPMPGLTNDEHRSVIHEGPLRLLEKQGKMDVYVFLFTDLLLITKAKKGDKYKVIKPPLQVDKLFISTSKDQGTFLLIYVNEYNIAVQAFALQGTITDQANWIDAIKKAQKLFMVAKLGQGSSNILQMRNNSDLVSPSGLVTPSGLSPAFSRLKRRSSSVSSIMSIDSDSDDESGLNIPNINSRARSDSAVTSASSTHSSEVRGKDVETDEKDDAVRQPQAEILSPEEEGAMGAMPRPRSESVGKISRSSSAPPKERPRVVDSSSLSRSSSAPQGPTSARVASLREGIIKRMATEEQDGSITSSSASLNDSAGDSEVQSPSTTTSADFPSLPPPDYQQTSEVRTEPQSPNQEDCEIEPSLPPAEEDITQCPSSPEKGVSSSLSDNDCETSEHAGELEEDSVEEPLESQGDLSPNEDCKVDLSIPQLGFTPGFHALQNLSHSLESTFKSNGPSKQAPQIKSQLIAQDKIQSAITLTEPPRKRISLPRRSSPVVSRKSRPQNLKKSREKDDHDINGILQKIRDASSASCSTTTEATTSNQERVCKVGKLTKRSSESSRLPVKPDKAHYPTSLDLESHPKADKRKEMPSNSLSRSRKKSMSLSDLLSIGKDLTSNREKSKDKDVDKDKSRPKSLEATSPQTDEEAVSPNYVDGHDNKKEEKKSRFSRLRRKSSRGVGELKDGIASGPDIDPKRASRHFFKESLMLETSEYV